MDPKILGLDLSSDVNKVGDLFLELRDLSVLVCEPSFQIAASPFDLYLLVDMAKRLLPKLVNKAVFLCNLPFMLDAGLCLLHIDAANSVTSSMIYER